MYLMRSATPNCIQQYSTSSPMESIMQILLIPVLVIFVMHWFYFYRKRIELNALLPPEAIGALPVIGHLLFIRKKPLHRTLMHLAEKHGSMFRLRLGAHSVIVITTASLALECLQKHDDAFLNRPKLPSGRIIAFEWSTMGTMNYGGKFHLLRKIASKEVLSSHKMKELSNVVEREIRSFAQGLLRHGSGQHARVELKSRLFELLMNLLMAIMCGQTNSGADSEEEAKWFRKMVQETMALSGLSNAWDFMPALLRWVDVGGLERRLRALCANRTAFLQKLIDEQRASIGSQAQAPNTMISAMLSKRHDDHLIRSLLVGLLEAGTSTTADTIEWAMSLLLNHPHTMRKVVDEIRGCVGSRSLLTANDLPRLPYLHCVINETLRLYPPTPLLLPHEATMDCTVGNYKILRGSTLLINSFPIHRDPNIWVQPDDFIPERFQDKDIAIESMYIPFGMGKRACPTKRMGLQMVAQTLGCMLQCFDWEREGQAPVDMREGSGLTMPKLVPLEAMFRPCTGIPQDLLV